MVLEVGEGLWILQDKEKKNKLSIKAQGQLESYTADQRAYLNHNLTQKPFFVFFRFWSTFSAEWNVLGFSFKISESLD